MTPKPEIAAMRSEADAAYCSALDLADKNCRGAQYKLENGKFTDEDLKWHCKHNEKIGYHRGMYRVLNALSNHVVIPEGEFAGIVEAIKFMDERLKARHYYSVEADKALAIAQKYAPEGKNV